MDLRPNPDDKRSKQVWIAEEGRRFRDSAIESLGGEISWLSEVIPPDERAALLPGLRWLRRVLDEHRSLHTA